MRISSTLWIVHRDARQRAALARIAGAGDNTFMGAPTDEVFANATPASVVLLAPSGDFESELEFVHRFSPRMPDCTWIVLAASGDRTEARRLFDCLPATFLRFPPTPERLRRTIARAGRHRGVDSLSRRRGRKLLTSRFARWFIGLDMPDLMRTLDPNLVHLPVLVRGEVGTGRGLVARYVHAFGGDDRAELLHLPCAGQTSERELIEFVGQADAGIREFRRTIWLEDVDQLPTAVQLRIRDWIEFGLPESMLRTSNVRFIVSAREALDDDDFDSDWDEDIAAPRLHPGLENALSHLVIRLSALRDREQAIEPFVADTALSWAQSRGERQRTFGAGAIRELTNYPWPGNMAQLETVVLRSLSQTNANPLEAHHLRFSDESLVVSEESLPMAEFVDDDFPEPEPFPISDTPLSDDITFAQPAGAHQEAPSSSPGSTQPTFEESGRPAVTSPGGGNAPPSAQPSTPSTQPSAQPPTKPPPKPPSMPAVPEFDEGALRRLVGALIHEIRNPLVSIKTFSELLPEHHADDDFRNRFAELVGADVRQIEAVVSRLQDLAQLAPARREPVDVASLLDRVIVEHEALIQERHLLMLKELDRTEPFVLADAAQLERALVGVMATALAMVPERGDVYLASQHNSQGFMGTPTVRILLRYHVPSLGRSLGDLLQDEGFRIEGVSQAETALEFLIAEAIVRLQGGAMTIDTTDAQETVIVIDLPAAAN